jgi:hypothetical protein
MWQRRRTLRWPDREPGGDVVGAIADAPAVADAARVEVWAPESATDRLVVIRYRGS